MFSLRVRPAAWLVVMLAASAICSVRAAGAPARAATAAREQAAPETSFARRAAEAAQARETGQLDEAIRLYRALVAERPEWSEGHWYLGSLFYEQRNARAARAAFARVLRLQPDHAAAMGLSGLCAFDLGDHDQALRELLQALQLNVRQVPAIADVVSFHAAILLTRFGQFEAANQLLASLAVGGQDDPQLIDAFGLNLMRLPLLPSEMPADGKDRVQLAGRAGHAMARRDLQGAHRLLADLRTRYGHTPHVHYVWGVLLAAEDPLQALQAWRRELEISPGHVPARLQLAAELLRQGEAATARPFADEAVQLDPRNFMPRLALGQVLLDLGEVAAAVSHLETATQLAPESAQSYYLLSVAYARAERPVDAERARTEFRRLSTAAPAVGPPAGQPQN